MKFKKQSFDFSNRGLTEFPKEIFDARRVYKLNLSNNNIKQIPKEIADLKQLETLDLSNNNIRQLKAKLFELPNLKILNLNNNDIINIPKQIGKFDKLKSLCLANNRISQIPTEVAFLQSLEKLNLTGNLLNNLPASNTSFKKLRTLWIAHNPLTNLTSERLRFGMPNLKAVYCYTPKVEKVLRCTDRGIMAGAAIKGNCITEIKSVDELRDAADRMFYPVKTISNETTGPQNILEVIPIKQVMPRIFISYSHMDLEHLKRLQIHLKAMKRRVPFDLWDDTMLISSDKWKEEIEKALNEATNAILLVSADFLASDFINENELPPLLKAAQIKGTRIHPVIVGPCNFLKFKSLSHFQAANNPDQSLAELSSARQERIWSQLCDDIESFFEQ